MIGNINFPNPDPAIEELISSHKEFMKSLAYHDGGTTTTFEKNQKRTTLLDLLRSLGLYVQANCNNNLSIAVSSGFKVKKAREKRRILDKPQHFKAEEGPYPGSIKLSLDPVKGAIIYLYMWALAPVNENAVWEFDLGKTRIIIENLIQGKEYAFKVAAKGSPRDKVFSDIITRFVS